MWNALLAGAVWWACAHLGGAGPWQQHKVSGRRGSGAAESSRSLDQGCVRGSSRLRCFLSLRRTNACLPAPAFHPQSVSRHLLLPPPLAGMDRSWHCRSAGAGGAWLGSGSVAAGAAAGCCAAGGGHGAGAAGGAAERRRAGGAGVFGAIAHTFLGASFCDVSPTTQYV